MPNNLKERWETEDGRDRLKRIIQAIQEGKEDWPDILKGFPGVDKLESGLDLRYADLSKLKLREAKLTNIRLDWANLSGANLENAELIGSNLYHASFCNTNLRKTDLSKAYIGNASFIAADIRGTNFDESKLGGDAIVCGHGSTSAKVDFSNVKYNRRTSFLNTDISRNNWSSNPLLKRHIEDQQWLHTWRNKHWFNKYFLYPIWLISCDCGRSFILWASWSLALALCFGFIFRNHAGFFNIANGMTMADAHWFMPFYYSIVTFTTLGFGDVVPDFNNGLMQLCVTLEVISGYIMLGGLISILATKLARRA